LSLPSFDRLQGKHSKRSNDAQAFANDPNTILTFANVRTRERVHLTTPPAT
jgi:hypothetical protein